MNPDWDARPALPEIDEWKQLWPLGFGCKPIEPIPPWLIWVGDLAASYMELVNEYTVPNLTLRNRPLPAYPLSERTKEYSSGK